MNVTTPTAPLKVTNNFTISFWYRSSTDAFGYFLTNTFDSNGGQGTGFGFYNLDNSGVLYFFKSYTNASTSIQVNTGGTDVNDGAWHHIVYTQDDTNGIELWLDGNSVDTEASRTEDVYYDATTQYFILGAESNDTVIGSYWAGDLDEVGVWSRVLTDAEIGELYNSGDGLQYPFTTGTNCQINIGDAWKDIDAMQINIGDTWKNVEGIQINIGDTWKTIL